MTDTDLMPFGKYKGTPLVSVPAHYLIWLHEKHRATKEVEIYILMNWDALQKEISDWKREHGKY
jgi:uncharacterized protein (DUF3820 family)